MGTIDISYYNLFIGLLLLAIPFFYLWKFKTGLLKPAVIGTSRKVFGKDLPNHQLHTVAERCGYHLENHHHALADAEACAQIALLIIPEPKKERKTKKADKDIHVGDLFASLIPQPVKKSK